MRSKKYIWLASGYISYIFIFLVVYPRLGFHTMILSIVLAGYIGWFGGLRIGFLSIIPTATLNQLLLLLFSAQPYEHMWAITPPGQIVSIALISMTGLLKRSYEKVDLLRSSLRTRIKQATLERQMLIQGLIEADEQERILIGQDVHDGAGQYLTSMLILSEVLSQTSGDESEGETALTAKMTRQIEQSIKTIRTLSRSLLPIKFSETTLESAFIELTDYFRDTSDIMITLNLQGSSSNIPSNTAQHVHRVFHEILYRVIYEYSATDLDIRVLIRVNEFCTSINGIASPDRVGTTPPLVSEMMKYRIEAIDGQHTDIVFPNGEFRFECAAKFSEKSRL